MLREKVVVEANKIVQYALHDKNPNLYSFYWGTLEGLLKGVEHRSEEWWFLQEVKDLFSYIIWSK